MACNSQDHDIRPAQICAHRARHVSVGLLGSIAAFLAVAVAGLTRQDAQMVRAAYPAMELIARSSSSR